LLAIYLPREAQTIVRWALEDLLHFKAAHFDKNNSLYKNSLTESEQEIWNAAVARLLAKEPLQYITERADFYGLKFRVNNQVLIPRPETEELVGWVLEEHHRKQQKKVLDIGTGSGCIPLSLQHNRPNWEITGLDISEKALNVAQNNAKHLNLTQTIFKKIDFLDHSAWPNLEKYDLIISNPPYIAATELAAMHENVTKFEPHLALFVPDNDVLLFYKTIAAFCATHLAENGALYVEIHEKLGVETVNLFRKSGIFNQIILQKDMSGRDRMIKCSRFLDN
jgi:release factor glutamine methyltransferase